MVFLWSFTLLTCVAVSYCEVSEASKETTVSCDFESVMKVVKDLEKRVDVLEAENQQLKAALVHQQYEENQRSDTDDVHSDTSTTDTKLRSAEDYGEKYRAQRATTEVTIAFYASLKNPVSHLGQSQNICFDHVVTNIGIAYDAHSGVFRAPLDGVYVFSTTVLTNARDTTHYGFALNGQTVTVMYVNGAENAYDADSQTIILQLKAGDDVSVRHIDSDKGLYGSNHSVFSGFLLSQLPESTAIIG